MGDDYQSKDADAEAILTRRAFLVQSALAGAGLGLGACKDREAPPAEPDTQEAQVCLSERPERPEAPTHGAPTGSDTAETMEGAQVCLEAVPPDSPEQPVNATDVSEAPPLTDVTSDAEPSDDGIEDDEAKPAPVVCLSVHRPSDDKLHDGEPTQPQVCLRIAPRKPEPLPCLSQEPI